MNWILVPCEAVRKDGTHGKKMHDQINLAVYLRRSVHNSWIMLSGGESRPDFRSEASVALDIVPDDEQHFTVTEEKALSRMETVWFVREYLKGFNIESLVIVTSRIDALRIKRYMKYHWRDARNVRYEHVPSDSVSHNVVCAIGLIAAWLDPNDKYILPLLRKASRLPAITQLKLWKTS